MVETNWRATHLLNASNDLVVLPNSVLAKAQLTNLSSPNRSHGVKLRVRIAPTMAPSAISDVMRTVLLSSNSIMLDAGAHGGDQVARCAGDRVRAVVPRQGFRRIGGPPGTRSTT